MPAEFEPDRPAAPAIGPAPVPVWLARLLRVQGGIGSLEEWIGIALVSAMAAVVNLQIVARYVFDKPFIWPEEVSRLILVWIAFVGAAALVRRGGDIAVETFIDMLAPVPIDLVINTNSLQEMPEAYVDFFMDWLEQTLTPALVQIR